MALKMAQKLLEKLSKKKRPLPQDVEFDRTVKVPDSVVKRIEQRAHTERRGGAVSEVNRDPLTINVELSTGEEFFFAGDEAKDLFQEVPKNVDAEDFMLWRLTRVI